MADAILAPSELEVMASLLQRLARAFNYEGGGIEAVGRVEIESLGNLLRLRPRESALELIAYWLEKQDCRVPLD